MIPFFSVTINEIVSEVIEAMKWVVDYAVENGSRYINNDLHQSKQIVAITNSNEVLFILNSYSGIALAGHSAGGQLCAMVLSSTWFEDASAEVKSLFKVRK